MFGWATVVGMAAESRRDQGLSQRHVRPHAVVDRVALAQLADLNDWCRHQILSARCRSTRPKYRRPLASSTRAEITDTRSAAGGAGPWTRLQRKPSITPTSGFKAYTYRSTPCTSELG